MPKKRKPINGVLDFHSETGTEGGYWAFQDERFISYVAPTYGVWGSQAVWDSSRPERKGKTRKDAEVLRNGKWYPLPDPMQKDPDYYASSLFQGEQRGNHEADRRLVKKYGFAIKYATDRMNERYGEGNWRLEADDPSTAILPDSTRVYCGGTPHTEPHRPYGVGAGELTRVTVEWEDGVVEQRLSDSLLVVSWSYEGLHVLRNGDHLTIYDKNDPSKVVWAGTIRLHEYDLFTEDAFGYWIHADQENIDRETWARWFFEEYPAKLILA